MNLFPKGIPVSKRLLDLLGAGLGMIVISPFLLIIGVLVWLRVGWPILFHQIRPGHREKPFSLIKFRTMTEDRGSSGVLLADGARLTPLGRSLRSFSLDELPELWNVLRGEMSLVGPRPLLMAYLPRYSLEQRRRHEVLPGITGWAQVNGRNALTWAEKFAFDLWYVDHWSLGLDLKILALTLWKAVRREGVNPPGRDTASEFMGSEDVPEPPTLGDPTP
jgi:lipopolysaccharide/colanic/teichoic acid biosynthesis glycosyltransferase